MGIFEKLFGQKKSESVNPDNSKLLKLLDTYCKLNGSENSYSDVANELMNGNSFLLLPSQNNGSNSEGWTTAENNTTLNLACVFNIDGLRVLGAFTDEESLLAWSKKPTQYTALSSKDTIKLCEREQIDRIVINSDQPTMFVLERNRENIESITIEEKTTVQVGTPNRPLDNKIVGKLADQFKRIEAIEEVYQYGQTRNNEFSIVLGFKLSNYSENTKTATLNAVQNALQGEKIDQLLDLFFIEEESWHQTIKNIENSLLYKN